MPFVPDKPSAGRFVPDEQPAQPGPMDVLRGWRDLAAGAVRGAGSIGATILAPLDMLNEALLNSARNPADPPVNIDRRADMTAALRDIGANTDSLGFGVGKLGAEVAGTLGVAPALGSIAGSTALSTQAPSVVRAIETAGMAGGKMLPRVIGGAVTGGASAGLVNPNDAGFGALVGGGLPPLAKAAGAAGSALGSAMRPNINNAPLADKAINQYGIPLGIADIADNRMLKATRSLLNDTPITGGMGERQAAAVQRGFNKAVGETFDAGSDVLTPQVMDAAKKNLGAKFDSIWGRNALAYDHQLANEIQALRAEATKLPQGDAGRLLSWLDDIEAKMVPDANGNLMMPGDVANRMQSKIRQTAEKANGFLKEDLIQLRKSLLGAFNRNVSPQDAAELAQAMGKYKAFKTVEPLMQGAEAGVAGRKVGDVPAGLLPQAVRKSYGSNIAGSPFNDLSQIGSQYIADRVARTGGGPRALIQNSMVGTALGLGGYTNPLLAASALPVAMGTQRALGSPMIANRLLNPGQGAAVPNALLEYGYRLPPVFLTADQ